VAAPGISTGALVVDLAAAAGVRVGYCEAADAATPITSFGYGVAAVTGAMLTEGAVEEAEGDCVAGLFQSTEAL